jgi:hypothetical protein
LKEFVGPLKPVLDQSEIGRVRVNVSRERVEENGSTGVPLWEDLCNIV